MVYINDDMYYSEFYIIMDVIDYHKLLYEYPKKIGCSISIESGNTIYRKEKREYYIMEKQKLYELLKSMSKMYHKLPYEVINHILNYLEDIDKLKVCMSSMKLRKLCFFKEIECVADDFDEWKKFGPKIWEIDCTADNKYGYICIDYFIEEEILNIKDKHKSLKFKRLYKDKIDIDTYRKSLCEEYNFMVLNRIEFMVDIKMYHEKKSI
jgi:hypothetical protein